MYHPLVAMETELNSCNGVFIYLKLCLNPDVLTELKEPEHQENYIALPAKTEEMV